MTQTPVYMQIKNYDEVLSHIDDLKQRLIRAHELLGDLHALRQEENELIHHTQGALADMRAHFHGIHKEVMTK
jgi:hypothetical protein